MATSKLLRPGATAVITGGASGVGFAMATIFRNAGMNLVLLDRDEASLNKATTQLKSLPSTSTHTNVKTESYPLDVSDLSAWTKLKSTITSQFPVIDILMLNAGTSVKPSTTQTWEDVSYFHKTLDTNMYGVVNGVATFLPQIQKTKDNRAAIIITGSKQGITNPPGAANPAYNMSKSALKTLAEHLAYDLRTPDNPSYSPNTSVHLLIPGWTFTGLSGNVGPTPEEEIMSKKPEGAWLPSQCAQFGIERIEKGKFYVVCPDNDVDEALDQARMAWGLGDVTENRPALSRWEEGNKEEAARWIEGEANRRRGLWGASTSH